MFLKPNLPVTVDMLSDHQNSISYPKSFIFDGQTYPVKEVKLHHAFKSGQTLYHTFCILAENNSFFRLVLDTDTLNWTLDEIADKKEG